MQILREFFKPVLTKIYKDRNFGKKFAKKLILTIVENVIALQKKSVTPLLIILEHSSIHQTDRKLAHLCTFEKKR